MRHVWRGKDFNLILKIYIFFFKLMSLPRIKLLSVKALEDDVILL